MLPSSLDDYVFSITPTLDRLRLEELEQIRVELVLARVA